MSQLSRLAAVERGRWRGWTVTVTGKSVLDERMPGDHDAGAAVLLEPAHRSQPRLGMLLLA